MNELNGSQRSLSQVSTGGIAGFLTILTVYPSFMEIRASEDTRVGCFPRRAYAYICCCFGR